MCTSRNDGVAEQTEAIADAAEPDSSRVDGEAGDEEGAQTSLPLDAAADGVDGNAPFDASDGGDSSPTDDGGDADGSPSEAGPDASDASDGADASDGGDASDAPSDASDGGDASDAPSDASDGPSDAPMDASSDAPDGEGGDDSLTPTEQVLYGVSPSLEACAATGGLLDPSVGGSNCEEGTPGETFSASQSSQCLSVLTCVLSSGCDLTSTPPQCLCGTVDGTTCKNDTGAVTLDGPCAEVYYASFGTMDVTQFFDSFYDPSTPAGSADALVSVLGELCSP